MPNIELSPDEALVLFELLERFSDTGVLEVKHPGEREALWNFTCALEKLLTEPFDPQYERLLTQARERLAGPTEPSSNEPPHE